ncbi:MAG: indolepyruvate ferredoxin oxidoreductase family protein [Acidimicrobiales bacterium]
MAAPTSRSTRRNLGRSGKIVRLPTAGTAPAGRGPRVSLDDKYTAGSGRVLMSGIEALVRTVLDQRRLDDARGLDTAAYVSGYEGSPLGGVDLEMRRASRFLDAGSIVFQAALNEELAATAVGGTQLIGELPGRRHQGVTGFWYGKNPGLDRAADAIRHGNHSGTAPLGGAVAWIGDDPTCKSSTLPSSCEAMAAGLMLPLLSPSSVAEIRRLGLHAVALSRFAGTWTGLKIVADLADGDATVELDDPATFVPEPDAGRAFRPARLLGATSLAAEEDLREARLPRAAEYEAAVSLNHVAFEPAQPRLAVVAAGLAFASVRRALDDLGLADDGLDALGVRLVKIGMPWPVDAGRWHRLLDGVDEVVVLEDKSSFLEAAIKQALYRRPHQPVVVGKADEAGRPLVPAHATVDSDLATSVLAARLGDRLPEVARHRLERMRRPERLSLTAGPLPARIPYFCSGCPHNLSTRAGADQLVGIGIGCHTMVAFDEVGRGHQVGMTQMGGEGAQWNGLFPFTDDRHYFQNLGDGTFFHSGSLAVRAAVAAGADITYKLLYNRAVAMTGGQQPEGALDVPDLTRWLALEGVRKVVVTTPDPSAYAGVDLDPIAEVRHRDELDAVQRELAEVGGVTVLLHDDRCAAEERRLRKRGKLPTPAMRLWINQRVCEGCGDCGRKSTCLSVVPVETELGRKTAIHQSSCNQDYACLLGDCPSFVAVVPGRRSGRRAALPELPVGLPQPTHRVPEDELLVRMPGIGGTGVVTVSRILQMAAHLDGKHAAGVEQTGLAQKGGPVISDVRISTRPIEASARAGARSVDVLLGFDPLGAASPANLATADADRTVAVVNTAQVATAEMVKDLSVAFPPPGSVAARIEAETRTGENAYLDADWIAERIADHLVTNMVLVGAAFQHGCLPISAGSIEEAVRLNGTAVDANLAAFRWGRAAVVDPVAVRERLAPSPATAAPAVHPAVRAALDAGPDLPRDLDDLLAARASDLVAYQDVGYARRYLDSVLEVLGAERAALPGAEPSVTPVVAANLYKLMAYKDEYEVARLHLDPVERDRLVAEFGRGARTRVLLHPPVLRALGLRRKISLGPATVPAFALLRRLRRLRGTPLDPFGRTAMRRTERALVDEYRELVARALVHLEPGTADEVRAIAALPEVIRGYESVKLAGVEEFRRQAARRLAALGDLATEVTRTA